MAEYWNAELETLPWGEVERWQAARVTEMLPALRRARASTRACMPACATTSPCVRPPTWRPCRSRSRTTCAPPRTQPATPSRSAPTRRRRATTSSRRSRRRGTTGRPLYYALTARDVEVFADAIANVWFTAGIRKGDIVAHLVGLPMVAGGLPYADGFRRIGATLCWLGGFPTERILREMRHLRVTACWRRPRSRSISPSAGTRSAARPASARACARCSAAASPAWPSPSCAGASSPASASRTCARRWASAT